MGVVKRSRMYSHRDGGGGPPEVKDVGGLSSGGVIKSAKEAVAAVEAAVSKSAQYTDPVAYANIVPISEDKAAFGTLPLKSSASQYPISHINIREPYDSNSIRLSIGGSLKQAGDDSLKSFVRFDVNSSGSAYSYRGNLNKYRGDDILDETYDPPEQALRDGFILASRYLIKGGANPKKHVIVYPRQASHIGLRDLDFLSNMTLEGLSKCKLSKS